jgi:endonuclease/exonuclease/phosphatase family metal-dependent hydrolase
MIRKLAVILCLMPAVIAWGNAANPAAMTIMTQNMDACTDLNFAIAELLKLLPPTVGVEFTYEEVLACQVNTRADLLAAQVAQRKPDLLALQEATIWRVGSSVETATTVLADQLDLLLASLATKGVLYNLVAVSTLTDVALPKASGGALRFTDRDVLLIRADLRPPTFHLSDVHSNTFDAVYGIGGLQVPAGWISAMIHTGNRHFRFVTTHLQSPVSFDPTAAQVQAAQAGQLLHELRNSTVPVVLAGDFNSDAIQGTAGPGPDNTDTTATIVAAGYADTWTLAGSGPGPTWPWSLEDQFPPPFFAHALPKERIDLIFSQGLGVVGVEHVLAPGPAANAWPYFASDHAGVIAVFQP